MKSVGFLILFVINLFVLSCKGQVSPNSTVKIGIPGSTVRLNWTYPGNHSVASLLWWFERRNDSKVEDIAYKRPAQSVHICNSNLPGVTIELMPPTLVLKNVDKRYNGKYVFSVQVADDGGKAKAEFYIAVKPNVTINCFSLIKLNEGDNFTCLCRGEGGNPPADVTWFRNGTQYGETGMENNTLTLTNVDEADNATYTCLAQSYPKHAMFNDSKSVVVQVKFKPKDTTIEFTQNPARLGTSVTIMCKSRGFPEPSYNITLNGTRIVSSEKTYTIHEVKWNDTGTYNCTATNERGSGWEAKFLDVTVEPTPTPTTPPPVPIPAIIGIIVGVLVLIIIVVVVVYCYKSKQKERGNRANIDPVPGNHYELENEEPGPGDGAYDTMAMGPVGASSSKSKPPAGNTLPPAYAAVDKNNRQGNTNGNVKPEASEDE